MVRLQKLVALSILTRIASGENGSFLEILAPRESEVLDVNDLTYTIKWTAMPSDGRCKIILLAGSSSNDMTELSGIASSVEVSTGSHIWPLERSPLSPELDLFYGIGITLDGDVGVSNVSAPFKITGEDDASITTKPVTASSASPSLPNPTLGATGSIDFATLGTESRPGTSMTQPPASAQATARNRQPGLSRSMIAVVVTAVVLFLLIFSGLGGLVLYYRRNLLARVKRSTSGRSVRSEIDGRFRKAELDARGPEVRVTRVYELDATREVREADGRMKPAELDAGNVAPAPPAVAPQDKSIRAGFS
ncbi:hypothetical protein EKO27_g9305 [Xylaria grammica]|uniref:Yeast cell wall synthesis Kre9/Knh1-like N-terminal domain-containing protein n=1 Tax=Xylaria grammica TaxID=363999 RepID=A0A439CUG6_9PEZI|nr:hypothetical protein EKO27_g9305 [Xylaria grammica]